jgi:hypothetical protein
VDWSERESVRAKLRLMVKRILRKYKYPPDLCRKTVRWNRPWCAAAGACAEQKKHTFAMNFRIRYSRA